MGGRGGGHLSRPRATTRRLAELAAALQPASTAGKQVAFDDDADALPVVTVAELRQHNTARSCWIASGGRVYDLTAFAEQHPGGARALLRFGGTDATTALNEIHTPHIVRTFVSDYLIGTLEGEALAPLPPPLPARALPVSDFSHGALDAPFPHDRFEGTGLEAVRFQWAALDHLLRSDAPSDDALDTRFAHRQKSYIAALENWDRDWLHVGAPEQYVPQMNIRLQLFLALEEARPMVYVSDATLLGKSESVGGERGDSRAAQREVLGQMLEWLPRRYPTRFRKSPSLRDDNRVNRC